MAKPVIMPEKNPPALGDPNMDRRMKRARLIRDGMSWRQACLRSGYSPSVAERGPRGYMDGNDGHRRPGVMKDFERAAKEATYKPGFLKAAAMHRLVTAIVEGRSSDVAREIEVLGKFKENDWFVNAATGTPVGIFVTLGDAEGDVTLEQTLAELKNFRDGGEYSCAWCAEDHSNAKELQVHTLDCPKRPVTINAITKTSSNEEAF